MRFRRRDLNGKSVAEVQCEGAWKRLSGNAEVAALLGDAGIAETNDLMCYLQLDSSGIAALADLAKTLPDANSALGVYLLPIVPRSFRDFMLYESHVINASRGMVRRLMPGAYQITRVFEAITRKPFPRFKPHKLWYQQPIYYLSNHINMLTEGDEMPWPSYTDMLDYELELGAILARPLRNSTADEAASAIGGFVVLNDFSARDVQIDEMQSGFGPQKAKHFASAISAEIVTADEVLPKLGQLTGSVAINGKNVAKVTDAGGQFSLIDAIAFASQSEGLVPGELFGSGTLPGGAGVENNAMISPGDRLTLNIDGLGSLTNRVASKEA